MKDPMQLKHEKFMQLAIDYAKEKNPIWPFATFIVNEQEEILIRASNATHLSPTFHGEIVAINALAKEYKDNVTGNLTLYTTGECCSMCQSAIHWTNVMGTSLSTVVFGTSLTTLKALWGHDIDISSKEIIAKSPCKIELVGPVLEIECNELFLTAKKDQETIDKYKPIWQNQSWDIATFCDTPAKNTSYSETHAWKIPL